MKQLTLLVFTIAVATASATMAAETPRPGRLDPRIRSVFYDPDQVITLRVYFGFQMMIEFGEEERIENVSVGDGSAWQITPNKRANLLFLKPVDRAGPTNMTVVTDRRRYAFELVSRPKGAERDMAYIVRFAYPPAPATVVASLPSPAAKPPEQRNTRYTYTGSRFALPSLVFDDGHFTYFKWPESASTPALFAVGPDGGESLVNYSVRDGYQVVEQTAPRFVLRNGKEVTTVINDGWMAPTAGALAPRPADAKTAREAAKAEGHAP